MIGVLFAVIGIFLIVHGNSSMLQRNHQESSKEKVSNETVENISYQEVLDYLTNKYQKEFQLIRKEKEYCLEVGTYSLSYTEVCSNYSVKNTIYKVKSLDDQIEFYVKHVSYDKENVTIPFEEDYHDLDYYDNYISYVVSRNLEKQLQEKYQEISNQDIQVNIYRGLGISDITLSNALQYLDKNIQVFQDTNVEVEEFLGFLTDVGIRISLKKDEVITKNNFKEEVAFVNQIKEIELEGVYIDTILIEYVNDNRYIEYDNESKLLELKKGEEKDSSISDSILLYPKKICLALETDENCLGYEEFIPLSSESFHF